MWKNENLAAIYNDYAKFSFGIGRSDAEEFFEKSLEMNPQYVAGHFSNSVKNSESNQIVPRDGKRTFSLKLSPDPKPYIGGLRGGYYEKEGYREEG
ncbi:MAG: hypothetical protein AYK18_17065 [Theionarchaea archaeon DG-70]|nr:MAG: hypothetical protein AYK18_17065 [Theionarchaea archaeon DG-70]